MTRQSYILAFAPRAEAYMSRVQASSYETWSKKTVGPRGAEDHLEESPRR